MDASQQRILMQEGLITAAQLQHVTQVSRSGDLCSELTRLGWLSLEQARRVRQLASETDEELPLMPHAPAAFQIERLLGKGGMGEVYAVRDRRMGREAALKLIPKEELRPEALQRFSREARTLAQLDHPGIPAVYEFGLTQSRQPYLLMSLIRGRTLSDWLVELNADSAIPSERSRLLEIFLKVCDTVAFAHEKRILHRDLKPDNIMLGEHGEVYVMDWGLTRTRDAPGALSNSQVESQRFSLTQAGAILGTLGYMAPEQANGESVEFEADVFALGAILFELLTGEKAIPIAAPFDMMQRTIQGRFLTLREADATQPAELEEIVSRAMMVDPRQRTATVSLLASQVREWRDAQKPQVSARPTPIPWITAAALILTTLLLAFAWIQLERSQLRAHEAQWSQSLNHQKNELDLCKGELATSSASLRALERRNQTSQALLDLYRDRPTLGFDSALLLSKLESIAQEAAADAAQSRAVGELAFSLLSVNPKARAIASAAFKRSLELDPRQPTLLFSIDRLNNDAPLDSDCARRILLELARSQPGLDLNKDEDSFVAFLLALKGPRDTPRYRERLLRARYFPAATSWACLELAALDRRQGKPEEARRARRDALLAAPASAEAWLTLAREERELGRTWVALCYETAALEFDERPELILDYILRLLGQSYLKDHSSEIFRWIGDEIERVQRIAGSPSEANRPLQRAIEARRAQWLYISLNDLQKGLAIMDRLLPASPEEKHVITARARFEASLGRHPQAVESYKEVIRAGLADQAWSYFGIVDSLLKLERYKEAAEFAKEALRVDPNSVPLGVHALSALRLAGHLKEAESLAKRLIDRDPINQYVMLECGRVQLSLEQFSKAARSFETAFQASDHQSVAAFESVADALIQERRFSEALLFLRTNFYFKSHAAQALGLESYALMALNRNEEASELLALATSLSRDNLQNKKLYASCRFLLKDYQGALKLVDLALDQSSKDVDSLILKADIFIELERFDEARKIFEFLESKEFPEAVQRKAREEKSRLLR